MPGKDTVLRAVAIAALFNLTEPPSSGRITDNFNALVGPQPNGSTAASNRFPSEIRDPNFQPEELPSSELLELQVPQQSLDAITPVAHDLTPAESLLGFAKLPSVGHVTPDIEEQINTTKP
jgi:hypothetical protein